MQVDQRNAPCVRWHKGCQITKSISKFVQDLYWNPGQQPQQSSYNDCFYGVYDRVSLGFWAVLAHSSAVDINSLIQHNCAFSTVYAHSAHDNEVCLGVTNTGGG
jgi:hypothetical protein